MDFERTSASIPPVISAGSGLGRTRMLRAASGFGAVGWPGSAPLAAWAEPLLNACAVFLVAMPLSSCGCDPEPGVWVPAEMVVSARRSAPRRLRTIRWREPGEGFGRDNLISPV